VLRFEHNGFRRKRCRSEQMTVKCVRMRFVISRSTHVASIKRLHERKRLRETTSCIGHVSACRSVAGRCSWNRQIDGQRRSICSIAFAIWRGYCRCRCAVPASAAVRTFALWTTIAPGHLPRTMKHLMPNSHRPPDTTKQCQFCVVMFGVPV